jgi:hypothetical protein
MAALAGAAHAATPPCFGAAARDPDHACENPGLRLSVTPRPAVARERANAPCRLLDPRAWFKVCAFGVRPSQATGEIALIGDSHASHWRAALAVVAASKRWRGYSITQTSCPLSKAVRALEERFRFRECVRWKPRVYTWLRNHPEVRTVFVSQLSGGLGIRTRRRDRFAATVDGYIGAWRALPRSVRRIIVIRDTPKTTRGSHACIERAVTAGRPPGSACARSRKAALDRDPAAVAAVRMRSRRVRLVDLTRFFCDARRCFPVIGGALVNKDITHITAVFGATLGPYLQRRVDALLP